MKFNLLILLSTTFMFAGIAEATPKVNTDPYTGYYQCATYYNADMFFNIKLLKAESGEPPTLAVQVSDHPIQYGKPGFFQPGATSGRKLLVVSYDGKRALPHRLELPSIQFGHVELLLCAEPKISEYCFKLMSVRGFSNGNVVGTCSRSAYRQ